MVTSNSDPTAVARLLFGFIPLFHCPICGGWRHYVVLQPIDYTPEWYVGWLSEDANGVSLLPNKGPVRVVEGAKPASWFGITKNGRQIPLRLLGKGRIGDGGPFANIPLR